MVVIINGKGGVGKDTLCEIAAKCFRTENVSSITPVKEIAKKCGWNGEKDAKSRKFLSELKQILIEYNDLPTKYLLSMYRKFQEGDSEIMFAHIREPEEIEKFKSQVAPECMCWTILVQRDAARESWGNNSDDQVEDYDYDFVFSNNGTIEEAEVKFAAFMKFLSDGGKISEA